MRFTESVAQMRYITPKMEARYAFFLRERRIFNLWQASIISIADFRRQQWYAADRSRRDTEGFRD
jgi:hypothetical protein